MKTIRTLAVPVLIAACGASCTKEEKAPPPKEDAELISVVFDAWNEKISVDGSALTIVHTQTRYEYDSPTSSTPSGSQTVRLLNGKVTREDLAALAKFIADSGFLDLQDRYGAPEGQRYYPYALGVAIRGQEPKRVEFHSNPEYENAPEAFQKLEHRLKELSETVRKR